MHGYPWGQPFGESAWALLSTLNREISNERWYREPIFSIGFQPPDVIVATGSADATERV
ncbi:hypothetical protein DSCOOX_41080 [Desulfosarcina ovata subsp. ovata]|uniref:Uncharacterized protein n=1 Tax=Desulfosarcina ovata subsp. ovata TaxID=2752305 RepID=A0A5K8AEL2_9BACT|nr:hypothetical protein DSCOOX_41080 [Desulfosarcina ovata subsp. ovata]